MGAVVGRWLERIGPAVRRPHTALAELRAAAEKRRRLGSHPLFARCSRAELNTLVHWGEELEVPAGVTLARERGIASYLVAVLDGGLRRTAGGRELDAVGIGGWTGALEVLGFAPEPATVTTAEDCRLFILGARPVLTFASRMRGLRAALFPSLDEAGATLRIRDLRAEGLAQWRQLRLEPPTSAHPPEPPPWLRVYRSRAASTSTPLRALLVSPREGDGEVGAAATTRPSAPVHLGRAAAIAVAALTLCAGVAGSVVRIPYYSVRGTTMSATVAVHVGADHHEPRGQILLPVIDVAQVTPLRALQAWNDDEADVRSSDEVLGGRTAADLDRDNLRLMAAAKAHAVAAVAELLPSLHLDPATVEIDSGQVGGPSGGLAFALALVDDRTPGDLTGGRTIAATGAIQPDGGVLDVGGIRLKTLAARRAGASVFVLPRVNVDDARPVAGSLVLIGVDSVAEAVQKLVARGGAIDG